MALFCLYYVLLNRRISNLLLRIDRTDVSVVELLKSPFVYAAVALLVANVVTCSVVGGCNEDAQEGMPIGLKHESVL
jgi:hypothetical protein